MVLSQPLFANSMHLKANPEPMFGSYYEGGLDSRHCFDREGRLGPYGFQSVEGNHTIQRAKFSKVDWDNVDWGSLQDQCAERNRDRYEYEPRASPLKLSYPTKKDILDSNQTVGSDEQEDSGRFPRSAKKYKKRTAVLLRGWDSLDYTSDILQNVRAMITELSLHSGGEYSVYLMIHIKDKEQAIFESPHEYQKALIDSVPRELHNISILFNVPLLEAWYPLISQDTGGLGQDQEHHMDQPLQLFSLLHPEFDHVWQSELDNRYTGHWYNFLENAAAWSRNQPRKLQWERHAKFYMPSAHSTYANLSAIIEEENPKGGIWGPLRSGTGTEKAVPSPAIPSPEGHVLEEDHYTWGVGEDADLLSTAPIVNVHPSASGSNSQIYTPMIPQNFPGDPDIPLRFLPYVPLVRVSKRLLRVMHASQIETGIDLIPETMPATLAVLHGFKVAFFPLPNYLDTENGDVTYNSDTVEKQMNGMGDDSPWKPGAPEEIGVMWSRMTFWWTSGKDQYPKRLYRKWLGGREQESLDFAKKADEEDEVKKENDRRRLCLPGILMHPIK